METLEILRNSKIEGNIVKLPPAKLDRNQYLEVKKKLELIGGKWKGGKVAGFVFEEDPTDLLKQIVSGKDINLKKEYQFFETPTALADQLVEYAQITKDDTILEPSAGRGAIIKAINRLIPTKKVDYFELMDINKTFLAKLINANLKGSDFTKSKKSTKYSKIIANPPFRKNQDIEHIKLMYDRLSVGGKLVSIASNHWRYSSNKKETEFRDWVNSINGVIFDIKPGAFEKSGTKIATCILVLRKHQ